MIGLEAGGGDGFSENSVAVVDEDLVLRLAGVEGIGVAGVLVRIDGIFESGMRPHAATLVEVNGDEFPCRDGRIFGSDEFDLETGREVEGGLLSLRSARLGVLDGLHFRFRRSLENRFRLELLDRDVLELDEEFPAGVGLEADETVTRDGGIFLHVIDGEHAVDPRADARPLAEDAVFVPVPVLHDGLERRLVHGNGDFLVPAVLVPDCAPVTDAGIHLVTRHVRVRLTEAANLDAGVCETFLLGELHLEAEIEIRVGLLMGEKGVERHLLLHRSADDLPVLDLPPFFLGFGDFPAIEAFSVEQRDGRGVGGAAEAEEDEWEFHLLRGRIFRNRRRRRARGRGRQSPSPPHGRDAGDTRRGFPCCQRS